MKYVEFYELKTTGYEKVGEVCLVGNGELEYHGPKADALRTTLENNAVVDHSVMPNVPHYPSDGDKEKYLSLLAQGFCGSYFRASEVLTR
jgi:hypothetical protein